MIRLGFPAPFVPRVRAPWIGAQAAAARLRRRTLDQILSCAEVVGAAGTRFRRIAADRLGLRSRAVARRRTQLLVFQEKYESLVDLLCLAAKEGVSPEREERYASLRRWMQSNYPRTAQRFRAHWLNPAIDDNVDPFMALFAPETLFDVINSPDSLDSIMRSRFAVDIVTLDDVVGAAVR